MNTLPSTRTKQNVKPKSAEKHGVYKQAFHRCYKRVGHIFQGKYKSIIVNHDAYYLELICYIHLNTWRAKMINHFINLDTVAIWQWLIEVGLRNGISGMNARSSPSILSKYVPQYEVRAFGSRVSCHAKKDSDLDLVIMTSQALSVKIMADIRYAFSEFVLPFTKRCQAGKLYCVEKK